MAVYKKFYGTYLQHGGSMKEWVHINANWYIVQYIFENEQIL